jgi:hypothetical protein
MVRLRLSVCHECPLQISVDKACLLAYACDVEQAGDCRAVRRLASALLWRRPSIVRHQVVDTRIGAERSICNEYICLATRGADCRGNCHNGPAHQQRILDAHQYLDWSHPLGYLVLIQHVDGRRVSASAPHTGVQCRMGSMHGPSSWTPAQLASDTTSAGRPYQRPTGWLPLYLG